MRAVFSYLVFLLLVAGAAAFGSGFPPGPWYAALTKPPLNPPSWLFGPVWSMLYLCIATAGWFSWRSGRGRGVALTLWGGQLALNALWSLLFFGLQRPGMALIDILALLCLLVITTVALFRIRPLSGWLMVPYALWVGFAAYLNAGLWYMNR
jgi:benzodiazapine receptor